MIIIWSTRGTGRKRAGIETELSSTKHKNSILTDEKWQEVWLC